MSAQTPDYALLERARVMIFAAHGAPVEMWNFGRWEIVDPIWDWESFNYRISPDWLNVPDGYEIVPMGEVVKGPRVRTPKGDWFHWSPGINYTNISTPHFLARPVAKPEPRKVPLSKKDWDGELIWWVRKDDHHEMVTGIYDDGIWTRGYVPYEQILEEGWERSPDRREWTGCWKWEEQS
jgi:hypothetical protein